MSNFARSIADHPAGRPPADSQKRGIRELRSLLIGTAAAALFVGPVYAQSSGNIAADELTTICEISASNGGQSCVDPSSGSSVPCPSFSTQVPLMTAQIQTPSGSGTGLVITPSLDVGLYTDTKISSSTGTLTGTDSEITGALITVTVDGKPVEPEVGNSNGVQGASGVVYDQRFQQLSTSNLTCTAGTTCNIDLLLSTMSAHSFNFVAPNLTQGTHAVNVYATLTNPPNKTTASACIGPGTLTAVQVKAFSQN